MPPILSVAQLARNTLAQIAMMTRFDPAHLALRVLMSDLLKIGELNRHLAGELSGFDIAYAHDPCTASPIQPRVAGRLIVRSCLKMALRQLFTPSSTMANGSP